MMKNKNLLIIIAILGLIFIALGGYLFISNMTLTSTNQSGNGSSGDKPYQDITSTNVFNIDIIKTVNTNETGNYLISPYSIEVALNMLKEGANSTTLEELERVIPTRKIGIIDVKDRISIANALFIKEEHKDSIKSEFIDSLKEKYNSEVLYDKFTTPEIIDNWADKKTNGMIKKVIDELSSDFVLGLANALAIDVEWKYGFECNSTREGDFTTTNTTKKVEMMHQTYKDNVKYIKTENEIGIILPYKSYESDGSELYESSDSTTDLEFIAVLPKNDVNEYINSLDLDKFNNLLDSGKELLENEQLLLSLPRFEYDYDFKTFKNALKNIGLKETMSGNPDFSKISDLSLYISQAVHKTHISLNEKGTKAAAITFFAMDKFGLAVDEKIEIEFNKPFMYVIRDKKSKELLFFGVVKEPNEWKGSTCESK